MQMRQIFEIDSLGFIAEVYVGKFENIQVDETIEGEPIFEEQLVAYMDETGEFVAVDKDFVTVAHPPYHKAKWTGTEWVEGATPEEIEEITKPQPVPPTREEILEQRVADLELMLLDILAP